MTLHITLPIALEDHISKQVASGRYNSAGEMIAEALLHLQHYQLVQSASLMRLQTEIDKGMQDIDEGFVKKMNIAEIKRKARASLN
jgi:putative addiction module CopG family antidote